MSRIILTTLNARYTHSALGLRYLYANMNQLQPETEILEFTINENIQNIAEQLLDKKPQIIGIGVYIWNALLTQELISIIKSVSPNTVVVLGGPEVSYTPMRVNFEKANFIIQGEADNSFYELCETLLQKRTVKTPIIKSEQPQLKTLKFPYSYYSEHDILNRYIYLEASRGCPLSCEFCLSSIDERVRKFEVEALLNEIKMLWGRGARNFKFIDRTFNLNIRTATKILDLFLEKEPPYFAHFEVIPDHFPDPLKERIGRFPPASLQLEIGIQTLNPKISKSINRPLNVKKIVENISFLQESSSAHMHLDLIVGLPNETLDSFGENLNTLVSLTHSEIQIGILKKLSGTTLERHDKEHGMLYSEIPPYDILQTNKITFKQIQEMKRFARFWNLIYNSGNFKKSASKLWQDKDVYSGFSAFSKWLFKQSASTWKISLNRLSKFLFEYLTDVKALNRAYVADIMIEDLLRAQGRELPTFLKEYSSNKMAYGKKVNKMHKRQLKFQ